MSADQPNDALEQSRPDAFDFIADGDPFDHFPWTVTFLRIEAIIDGSRAKVSRFRYANGEQAVELKSGARLKFAARSGSSGRGFAGVSTLFDEAQHLDPEAVAAASGAMAVAENPQIWLAGSAGLRPEGPT